VGIGVVELVILVVFFLFLWFSIKVARHSFGFLKKAKQDEKSVGSNSVEKDDFDIITFQFVSDKMLSEREIVSMQEEIPLDNRHGTSPLISEHEFSRTVTNSFVINKTQLTDGRIKTSLWTLIETEVRKNLSKSMGIEFGEQITRRVTVKFEAAPGTLVRYKIIWKQKQRDGSALINMENKQLQIPYSSTFGLFHAVESIQG